jgi:integrating conjugative element protein (TIGR03759 family)
MEVSERLRSKHVTPSVRTCIKAAIVLAAAASISLVLSLNAHGAQESKTTVTQSAPVENKQQDINAIAQSWGITPEEYQRYLQVMRGPRGTWSSDADPILALGVSAESPVEMRKYAEKYVMQEFERTEKELAFQREVTAAWKRLFPTTPRIGAMPSSVPVAQPRPTNAVATVAPPRMAVIVQKACERCTQAIQQYTQLASQRSALEAVDFYVSDSQGKDRVLQDWVDDNAIPLTLLKQGKITVNHASAHSAITRFPTVFERRSDGKWVEKALR